MLVHSWVSTQTEPLEGRKASGSFLCPPPQHNATGERSLAASAPGSLFIGHWTPDDFRDNTLPVFDTLKVSKRVWPTG